MTSVTIDQAKMQLPQRVERGEEVIITRGNKPVARLVPFVSERPERSFGLA
jgi:prevent-host-death family protein